MGTVYHAVDRWRGTRVALKSVGRGEGASLLRFKREFRALCDVDHPNLVRLGELFEEDGEWFFTMELVDGVEFLEYVRGGSANRPTESKAAPERTRTTVTPSGDESEGESLASSDAAAPMVAPVEVDRLAAHPLASTRLHFDEVRLRAAFAQLVEAVAALHALHKVHRDIKSSNVLVTHEGRVVLIDFGLVTELRGGLQATDIGFVGTMSYMAPEQAEGKPVDERSDWYAVGVVLFEALTGRLPFEGPPLQVVSRKVSNDPPAPSSLCPGIPRDLDELCRAMIARRPEDRPSEKEIFRRLFIEPSSTGQPRHARTSGSSANTVFVGRSRELAELGTLADGVLEGRGACALVHGESGIGKSALVAQLARTLEQSDQGWLVLRGRGAPRESVPFHAVDEIVDDLSGNLSRRTKEEVAALSPPNLPLLARTFPVLRRVGAFGRIGRTEPIAAHEQRARVFGALRELVRRIAEKQPLLVVVEDLQWIDSDSAALLAEMLREPGAPRMLFVATTRTVRADEAPELAPALAAVRFVDVPLGRLSDPESRELARELVHLTSDTAPETSEIWLSAASGHPLFLEEMLLRRPTEVRVEGGAVDLDAVLAARFSQLASPSQEILRVLAVAGHPVPVEILVGATELPPSEVERHAGRLRIERLLRYATTSTRASYEPYHGRIRDAVLSTMAVEAQRAMHERLAHVYEATGLGTPDLLAIHFREAGDLESAARYAERAARRATEALAFDHAATLFRTALAWENAQGRDRRDLRIAYAEALAYAGRGEDSADAYLEASCHTAALEAVDLRRRAGEQLMLSGRFDRGIALFRTILREVHERYTETALGTLIDIAWLGFRLFLRGEKVVERHESELAPEPKLRLDMVFSIAIGLTPVDSIRGLRFIMRAHLLALELGEPGRLARALTYSVGRIVGTSSHRAPEARAILEKAAALASRSANPTDRALVVYWKGMVENLVGNFPAALTLLLEADRLFREECPSPPSEFRTVQTLIPFLHLELGAFRDLRERASRTLREARELDDLMIDVNVHCIALQIVGCMDDAPSAAHEAATAAMARWPLRGSNQDASFMEGSAACALYEGRAAEAVDVIDRSWPLLRSAMVFFIPLMRIRAHRMRGLARLALAAASSRDRGRMLRLAQCDIRALRREKTPWATAIAEHLEATSLALSGSTAEAIRRFERAARLYDELGVVAHREACNRRRGELLGADGVELVRAADAYFVEEGVKVPERMVDILVPRVKAERDRTQ